MPLLKGKPALEPDVELQNAPMEEPVAPEKKKGSVIGILVPIVILAIVAGFILLIALNVFGLRDKVVRPVLEKIPIVNSLLSDPETTANGEQDLSKEELLVKVAQLEDELAEATQNNGELAKQINDQNLELLRLQEIEAQHIQFTLDKEAFDNMVALGDPAAFVQFYERIADENLEPLYLEAATTVEEEKAIKAYIDTFSSMNAKRIAPVLEKLIGTDMRLVVQILNRLDSEQRGAILAAMSADSAASVTKQMAPDTLAN